MSEITTHDAMSVIAKKIPETGITVREFITEAARLKGEPDTAIEAALDLLAQDGTMPDDIVKAGPALTRMH